MFTKLIIKMLNRKSAKTAPTVLKNLEITPGMKIADIGCGGGYFAFSFAGLIGDGGCVYAIDSDEARIEAVESRMKTEGITNVIPVKVDKQFPEIEECDLIFSRNSFHHIDHPCEYFKKVKENLAPNARIAIIDYNKNIFWGKLRNEKHFTEHSELIHIMEEAGYHCIADYKQLPNQLFCIFATVKNS